MTTYQRHLTDVLEHRLGEPAPLIQVLLGPRQVGKTTSVKMALQGRGVYETADYPTPLQPSILNEWWDRALVSTDKILAVDEIQKIQGWSEVIKRRWDENPKKIKVILTGSSALLLEKGLRETLAGRFELIRANHWSFKEASAAFGIDLHKYIEFGCYPGSVGLYEDVDRWAAYIRDSIVESVIGRDLLVLHPVENPALLRQVFGVAAGMPAMIISLQKFLGQLQYSGSIPTVQNYLNLLSQAFLVTPIEKIATNVVRSKKSSPKIIVHDNALVRAFERPISARISPQRFGHYFENVVGARFIEAGWNVFYWKDRDNEVDFVVHGPENQRWAIEVKSTEIDPGDLEGLRKFTKDHPGYESYFVSLVGQTIPGIKNLSAKFVLSL